MKVYVITEGNYSDYHICTVTTNKERAEKLVKIFSDNWDDAKIEEYDTESETNKAALAGRIPFSVYSECLQQWIFNWYGTRLQSR